MLVKADHAVRAARIINTDAAVRLGRADSWIGAGAARMQRPSSSHRARRVDGFVFMRPRRHGRQRVYSFATVSIHTQVVGLGRGRRRGAHPPLRVGLVSC